MQSRKNQKARWLWQSGLAVSVVLLIVALPFFLLWLDARITPPKMQKHKWMLTETFGTGVSPLDVFGMSLEEMDERLRGRGFERSLRTDLDPETQWGWQTDEVELLYSITWLNNLIICGTNGEWKLDSGVKFGGWKTSVEQVYGVPEKSLPRSMVYYYMPDSGRYFKALFVFSQQGRLEEVGYAFRQRRALDRLLLSIPSR